MSFDHRYEDTVEAVGQLVEAAGVAVIVLGIGWATVRYLLNLNGTRRYQAYRQGVGRAILLGLEFLVAGDIIRTVAVEPTFESLGVLAGLVAIRTFLSLSLEVEISGRWPWQDRPRPAPEAVHEPRAPGGG